MRLHAIGIVVSFLLCGCSQENSSATDSASITATTAQRCAKDADCTDDLICEQGMCKTDDGHEVMCPTTPDYLSRDRVAGCFSFCQSNETLTNDPYTPKCFSNVSRIIVTTLINKTAEEQKHEISDVRFSNPIQVPMSRADHANNALRRSIIGVNYLVRNKPNSPWREESLCISANTVDRGNETLADSDHEIAIEAVPIKSECCDKNWYPPEHWYCKPQYRIVPEKS